MTFFLKKEFDSFFKSKLRRKWKERRFKTNKNWLKRKGIKKAQVGEGEGQGETFPPHRCPTPVRESIFTSGWAASMTARAKLSSTHEKSNRVFNSLHPVLEDLLVIKDCFKHSGELDNG